MTTISSNGLSSAEAISSRRTTIAGKSELDPGKPKAMTAGEAADVARSSAGKGDAGSEAGPASRVTLTAESGSFTPKLKPMTAEEKAEVGRVMASAAAVMAAAETQRLEIEKSNLAENNTANLPNISTLSLQDAKMMVDVTQEMIESDRYKGIIVNGHNGDQQISDFGTYKAALVDYINNYQTDASKPGGATVSSQASTTAAATYRQMQALIGKGGSEG
jgi:hypothetical protein